jgi:arginine utilization protein RocB
MNEIDKIKEAAFYERKRIEEDAFYERKRIERESGSHSAAGGDWFPKGSIEMSDGQAWAIAALSMAIAYLWIFVL